MKNKVLPGLRILLGLMLAVFGMNKLVPFMPPQEMSDLALQGFGALMGAKFVMPTVAVVEVAVGIALLTNRFTALALVILVPISYGMVAFHAAFDMAGMAMAAFVALLNIILLMEQKDKFSEVLKVKA